MANAWILRFAQNDNANRTTAKADSSAALRNDKQRTGNSKGESKY
jgi:hypothetical protein